MINFIYRNKKGAVKTLLFLFLFLLKDCLMKFTLKIILLTLCTLVSCTSNQHDLSSSSVDPDLRDTLNILLDESVDLINDKEFGKANQKLSKLLETARKGNDSLSLTSAWNNVALLKLRTGNLDSSISANHVALEIARDIKRQDKEAISLKNLGIGYRLKGQFQTAIINYRESLLIVESQRDSNEIASINNSIGNLYNRLKNYEKALEHFNQAQNIWTAINEKNKMIIALGNYGNALLGLGRVEEAIDVYQRTLTLKRPLNDKFSIAITLNNLGEALAEKGRLSVAEENFLESIKLREESKQRSGIALVSNNLAALEIKKGNTQKAQSWLDKANTIIEETGATDRIVENLRLQKEIYALNGNYKKAYEIDASYDERVQKDFNEQIVNVQKREFEYDLDQEAKAKELFKARFESSEAQRESQKLRTLVQTYALIIIVLIAIIIGYLALKLRKKNRHIENLMRELHHRVKNHLGMISGMFGAQSEQATANNADLLEEAKTRVEAVNGIHRRLYRQDEYEFVNMQEYLTELVDNSALVFGLYQNIHKELNIDSEPLEIDKAISVGLIANEVLTNAFKYGLQKADEPMLKIVLEKVVKGYRMVIFNNAAPDQKPITESTGFGKELIKRLTTNLKGESRTIQQNGFQFELTFP